MKTTRTARERHLDFEAISRIGNMQLLARTVVDGFILGLHRSPYRGFSAEFAEYRQYAPGDDVRHVDWKVYAKTDRYYIKQFEEDTNVACHVLLDASGSMAYRSADTGFSKLHYAASIAACLCDLMMRQRDAVGLTVFDEGVRFVMPPRLRRAHLDVILAELDALQPGGETNIAGPLHDLARTLQRTGLVILISDLLDTPGDVLSALRHFRFSGHDVIVLHVMDDAELTFPFETMTELTDMETGEKMLVSPESVRASYMTELKCFLSHYEKGCADARADYKLLDTRSPLDLSLSEYLHRRSRMN